MTGLTWLHLSDWHQKGKEFGRTKVRNALMKDIRERATISPDLSKIDFIVFSGDVAYHGTTEEYQAAIAEFFAPLLEAADVGRDRLFIVPGNHDLEWAALELLPGDLLQKLNSPDRVNEWLTNERKRRTLLGPMEAYSQFITNYLGKDAAGLESAYGYVRRFDAGGKKIAVIGLNSAWLCARNRDANGEVNDRGYLILGEPQVYDALVKSEDAEVRIAVLHHPFDWLVEFDQHRVEERLGRQCHFILRGHQHLPQVNVVRGTAGDCVIIPAGASYDRDISSDPRYVNAYNFVHLDFDTGQGVVYLRRWSVRREEWVADTDSWERGQFSFTLPKELGRRGARPPSLPEPAKPSVRPHLDRERAVLEDYLRVLIRDNADLEPGGIKQTKVQVVLPLDEIYISLQADRDRPDVDRRVMQEELDEIKRRLEREEDPNEREKQYQIWAQQARTLQQALELAGPREELSDIVQRHRQVVILGEPGSGKTTLLRYLTMRFARAILAEPDRIFQPQEWWDDKNAWRLPDLGPVRLPILMRISHYAEARQKEPDLALIDYLPRYFAGLQMPHADELGPLLRRLLEKGRCLVLLDGLDEIIDPADRRNIANAIGQFVGIFREMGLPDWLSRSLVSPLPRREMKVKAEAEEEQGEMVIPWDKDVPEDVRQEWEKRFKEMRRERRRGAKARQMAWELLREARYAHVGNRFVVTSRIAGYHFAGVPGDFEHYTIRRMSPEQIKLFLERWCPAVERRIAEAPDPAQVEQRARREIDGILRAIETTPGVRRMAENPLLLRILAIIHRNEAHLPQRRVELYETATVTLLRDWHLERGTKGVAIDDVKAMSLLGPVAFYIHENRASGFLTRGETERMLSSILARDRGEDPENPSLETREAVRDFLETVRQHSGLFVERGEGLYGFMHLTFQEYFTARQLVSSSGRARQQILERLHLPRWREPILLAVGSLSKQFYEDTHDLLQAILEAGSEYESVLHRDLLFAAACVGDSVNVAPVLRQEIARRLLAIYCDRRHAGRYRLLQKQIKDALLSLCNDQGDLAVEAALADVLTRCTDRTAMSCALEAVEWLKARTPAVARALAACADPAMLPRAHQLLREMQSRLLVNGDNRRPAPPGWDVYRDDPALARLMGAMFECKGQKGVVDIVEILGSSIPSEPGNPLSIGMTVILGRHRPVDGEDNWNEEMNAFVGQIGHVTQLRGQDNQGCWGVRVDVDNERWFWRVRDLRIVTPEGNEVSGEIYASKSLVERIETAGQQILRSAENFGTLAPLFAARASRLIPLEPVPDDDALRASVQAIQSDLARALLDILRTTNDPQRYHEAALFLIRTGEGEPHDRAISTVMDDLEGVDVHRRRLALQVLTEPTFSKGISLTDTQRALLLSLLDGPADQAVLSLDILLTTSGLTPELLTRIWAILHHPDHPLGDIAREKLDELKEVKGTGPFLVLLDEGRRDSVLRPVALELLRKVTWQGTETFAQALVWLQDTDTEVRHLAALLLAQQDDLLAVPRNVLLTATQERLKAAQPTPGASWATLRTDSRVVRLLGGLWLQGWDDALTQLWVAQPAQTYVDWKHPRKYWRDFRTYPESEDAIRWLLEKAEFGRTLIPVFQQAATRLAELEQGAAQGEPKAEHIATVQQEIQQWAEAILAQPVTPPLLRAETAAFLAAIRKEPVSPLPDNILRAADADEALIGLGLLLRVKQPPASPYAWLRAVCASGNSHPLAIWLRQTLARHGLTPDAPPAVLARLLLNDDTDTQIAAALVLLAADLPALLVPILVEAALSQDDRIRLKGEQTLSSFSYNRLPGDGSTQAVEWLHHKNQAAKRHEGTLLVNAVSNINYTTAYWPERWVRLVENGTKAEHRFARYALGHVNRVSGDLLDTLCQHSQDLKKPISVRYATTTALIQVRRLQREARVNSRLTDTLCTVLNDPEPKVRRNAAYALQWTEGQGAWDVAQALLRAAQSDPDAETRILALRSLGRVLHTVRGFRDVDISKEALLRWLLQKCPSWMDDFVKSIGELPPLKVAPDANAALDTLAHPDTLGLPEETVTRLRGSEEWDKLLESARQEWQIRGYWAQTLPLLPAAIAQVETLLSFPDPATRRAAACALARLYHGDDDRPARLRDLLPDDIAVLKAMLDAATDRDQWGDEGSSDVSHHPWAVKQIATWVEAQPREEREQLIDVMLDALQREVEEMERQKDEEDNEDRFTDPYSDWAVRRILVATLAELSERLTYRAFTRTRDLADVVSLFARAATDPGSYSARRFAIRVLGNLQQLTDQVADVFFAACQDVGKVYRETRTAVSKFKVFGPGSLERLTAAVSSPSITVAYHAALLLGELGVSRSEELGREGRKRVADELVRLLENPLSERIVYDFTKSSDGERVGPLYDVIYEALVRVVAGPDAPVGALSVSLESSTLANEFVLAAPPPPPAV